MLVYSGCAKVDLIDLWDVSGHLIITPDNSTHTLPALEYHFYNANGKNNVITASCDGEGNYVGDISMGIYRAIAVCAGADNAELRDMEQCETAAVYVLGIDLDARSGEACFACPGDVYAVVLDNFAVNPKDTVRHTPQPVLLTKYIQVSLILNNELKEGLTSVTGILRGVSPSVNLFTCTSSEADNVALNTTRFSIYPNEDWRTTIPVLDIYNPNYGKVYANILSLSLYSDTNGVEHVDVELTKLFSDAIIRNKGVLPTNVPVEIKISRTTIGLEGGVSPWEESGGGNGNVPFNSPEFLID